MLEEFPNYNDQILLEREELIRTNKTSGNNKALSIYKIHLPPLPQIAFSWVMGLLLSDATLQRSSSTSNITLRMKIQQATCNRELLDVTLEILKPFGFVISPVANRDMVSFATITHETFNIFGEIFQNPQIPLRPNDCVHKLIPENIEDYLDPICISSWFCGDGGREDYTPNQGRGILFHSQGFTRDCNERLANALRRKYGWETSVELDYTKGDQSFYLVRVASSSFNSVERIIKPYILPSFLRKFPPPRSSNSKYLDN